MYASSQYVNIIGVSQKCVVTRVQLYVAQCCVRMGSSSRCCAGYLHIVFYICCSSNIPRFLLNSANHSSLIRNNVFPCICLRVMTYAWSDVTRNAGIRKTNRATRYVAPCIFAHAFNDVTHMINEYNVHIADACFYIAAHALPDAHCIIAL